MKSFKQLVEEKNKTSNPVTMAFGRMNPPTTGHLKLIDKVKEIAAHHKSAHTVIVSHSQDSKKNPLSGDQKVKHLKRYSPGTHFETSSKEQPSIFHHAAKLHAAGHDHLIVVAGSDRVKEFHDTLHKYNGVKGNHGYYNFKKIEVKSAGHRDPDAEGAEGMSATKMREHAKNNDFSSFRQGVPHHVADTHAKELMKDVRKGMGMNESYNRGNYKAIFVTGGPGSGKDIILRESIAESRMVELNFTQAVTYLGDKHKLSEKTNDLRREQIRQKGPLIINGPADDIEKISYIKEELEELGYDTMMVFVDTTNEVSMERNTLLTRMMVESVRQDKWEKSQKNNKLFTEMFNSLVLFDNTGDIEEKEQDIHEVYQITKMFLDQKKYTTYTESTPTLKLAPAPKEPNFNKDKESTKKDRRGIIGDKQPGRVMKPDGVGAQYNTVGANGGASGLGNSTYSESSKIKSFKNFREATDATDMGVYGMNGSASNKEPMSSYSDQQRNLGFQLKKKKQNRRDTNDVQ
jgi:predicted kinase